MSQWGRNRKRQRVVWARRDRGNKRHHGAHAGGQRASATLVTCMVHKGNDVANELANLGRIMPVPGTNYHSPLCGEERVHMVRAGRVCEGDITDEIKAAIGQRLRTMMREGKAHMRQLSEMLEASDAVMRHTIMKGRTVSTRFKVRAMSDSMPTVKHEWDKV